MRKRRSEICPSGDARVKKQEHLLRMDIVACRLYSKRGGIVIGRCA